MNDDARASLVEIFCAILVALVVAVLFMLMVPWLCYYLDWIFSPIQDYWKWCDEIQKN